MKKYILLSIIYISVTMLTAMEGKVKKWITYHPDYGWTKYDIFYNPEKDAFFIGLYPSVSFEKANPVSFKSYTPEENTAVTVLKRMRLTRSFFDLKEEFRNNRKKRRLQKEDSFKKPFLRPSKKHKKNTTNIHRRSSRRKNNTINNT